MHCSALRAPGKREGDQEVSPALLPHWDIADANAFIKDAIASAHRLGKVLFKSVRV
jgi:hypothetical protein